ncbi:hypothetical protein [Paenibacillus spongiae]|uniref:DUF4190 domain-containing protein n=1 Tax=Paenibacillus spongiae TaxID=2909671 RepID=A0ABY5SGE7_9BACL|nr:hypothetical protein [Paenibacillus spongiae]UVI33016.1 hypothetical protein L1F29_14775 [Paenibacillus spongiae]
MNEDRYIMAVVSVLLSFSSFFLFMYPIGGIIIAMVSCVLGHKSRYATVESHMWVGGNPGRVGRNLAVCSIVLNLFMWFVLHEMPVQ